MKLIATVGILVTALCSGSARADISGAQAEAMGEYAVRQETELVVSVLSACASAYPETRESSTSAMTDWVPQLRDNPALADNWIAKVGKCMDKQHTLSKESCTSFASRVRPDTIDVEYKSMAPMFDRGIEMLESCRQGD